MSLFDQTNVFAETEHGIFLVPPGRLDWGTLLASNRVVTPDQYQFINPSWVIALKIDDTERLKDGMFTDLPLLIPTANLNENAILEIIEQCFDYAPGVCLLYQSITVPTPKDQVNLGRIAALAELLDQYGSENMTVGWVSHHPYYNPAMLAMAYAYGATQFSFQIKSDTAPSPERGGCMTLGDLAAVMAKLPELELMYGDDSL